MYLVFLLYCAAVALGVWVSLKAHISTQMIWTLAAAGIVALGFVGVQRQHVSLEDGLTILFLVMYPCAIFIPTLWGTTAIRMLYGYVKRD